MRREATYTSNRRSQSIPRLVVLTCASLLVAAETVFAATCQMGWSFENVTMGFGGPSIEGVPASISWDQPAYGMRDDVFARGDGGHLIHYYRFAGQAWQPGEDLTVLANTPQHVISGDPVVVLDTQELDGLPTVSAPRRLRPRTRRRSHPLLVVSHPS